MARQRIGFRRMISALKRMRALNIIVLLMMASSARASAQQRSAHHAAWSRKAVIYEINVRQYTPEGTFSALETHLPRLQRLGVDILWLMPVQPIGIVNRKGGLGSYYSIRDYTAVNSEFGNQLDFKRFVEHAHRRGMRVILDWVANHTAFDHPWISAHKDYYALRPDGTISYARDNEGRETDWTDVAELNYDNRDMRAAMIAAMRWWLEEMGIDGFRCDVAGGVPDDFWAEATTTLRGVRPDLFMLAEAEGPKYHAWFDMTYGWELHHMLNEIAQAKKPAHALAAYFASQEKNYPADAYRMYFTSNHDENSWAGTEFERMGANHLPAFVLAATVQQSMPLLYSGQEASLNKRLRFFEKDTVDWGGTSLASFYHRMFELKHSQRALWNGAAGGKQRELGTNQRDRTYVFTRARGNNYVLVAVNFGAAPVTVAYAGLAKPGKYRDWFANRAVTMRAQGTIHIPANGFRVLVR